MRMQISIQYSVWCYYWRGKCSNISAVSEYGCAKATGSGELTSGLGGVVGGTLPPYLPFPPPPILSHVWVPLYYHPLIWVDEGTRLPPSIYPFLLPFLRLPFSHLPFPSSPFFLPLRFPPSSFLPPPPSGKSLPGTLCLVSRKLHSEISFVLDKTKEFWGKIPKNLFSVDFQTIDCFDLICIWEGKTILSSEKIKECGGKGWMHFHGFMFHRKSRVLQVRARQVLFVVHQSKKSFHQLVQLSPI